MYVQKHPLIITLFYVIIFTLLFDSISGRLSLGVGGDTWYHFVHFPIWNYCIVFIVCRLIRTATIETWFNTQSIHPANNPMYTSVVIGMFVTFISEWAQNKFDLTIMSDIWVHLAHIPVYVTFISFAACFIYRILFITGLYKLISMYKPKKQGIESVELPAIRSKKDKYKRKTVRINTDQPIVSSISSGRDITSATPLTGRKTGFNIV